MALHGTQEFSQADKFDTDLFSGHGGNADRAYNIPEFPKEHRVPTWMRPPIGNPEPRSCGLLGSHIFP